MSERRIDPFTGRGVVIAPGRRGIGGVKPGGLPEPSGRCPFCPGHESDTEATVAQWPVEGPWQVRVVANKFPVVSASSDASGHHEVGIDAREHDVDLADLSVSHVAAMLGVYRDRVRALEARPDVRAVMLFRNRGRRAGSSQPHPHTQITALGWVPVEVALRERIAREHREVHGESVLVRTLRRELDEGTRVIAAGARFVSYCPFAPTRPFEVRIAPREEGVRFAWTPDEALEELATLLVDAYARLRKAGITDDNVVLRQHASASGDPSWHLEILPRTGGDAGFELSTGEMIVVVTPEDSANQLRSILD